MSLTRAQRAALELCEGAGLTEMQRTIYAIRRGTLERLADAGLIQFRPYAREPRWTVTRAGREAASGWRKL